MEQRNNNIGISNGFIIGFLLGIVVTLLFTTKRGREIVNMLTQKGVKKIEDWKDVLEATEGGFFAEDEDLPIEEPVKEQAKTHQESESKTEKKEASEPAAKPIGRRFFRKG